MNGPRRLLLKTARLAATAAALVLAIMFMPVASDYYAGYADKTKRLHSVGGERVIAASGSGLAFGLDSTAVSKVTGKPVINMGFHAGAGLDLILRHVLPGVRAGDYVFVVPEYGTLSNQLGADDGVIASMLLGDALTLYPYWQWADVAPVVRGFPDLAIHRVIVDPAIELRRRFFTHELVLRRSSFDANGDINTPEVPPRSEPWTMKIDPKITAQVHLLNTFDAAVRARGARAVFLYSSIPRSVATANAAALESIQQTIEPDLEMPHVGTPIEAVQPDDHFFDTPQHPNRVGRVVETGRIIAALRSVGMAAPLPEPSN